MSMYDSIGIQRKDSEPIILVDIQNYEPMEYWIKDAGTHIEDNKYELSESALLTLIDEIEPMIKYMDKKWDYEHQCFFDEEGWPETVPYLSDFNPSDSNFSFASHKLRNLYHAAKACLIFLDNYSYDRESCHVYGYTEY